MLRERPELCRRSQRAAGRRTGVRPPRCKHASRTSNGKLVYGSDFSGLEAAPISLERLGLAGKLVEHVCASGVNPHCRELLAANYTIGRIDADIRERSIQRLKSQFKRLDLYTAGFPCQSYRKQ